MTVRVVAVIAALGIAIHPLTAAAHIVILSPNGGEVYTAGDVVEIRWCIAVAHTLVDWDLRYNPNLSGFDASCGDVVGGFLAIELNVPPTCTAAGGGICFLDPDPPCCMSYFWTVPDGVDSDAVKIKIKMDNTGTDYYDVSDGPFTIMPSPTSARVSPAGHEFGLEQNQPNPFSPATRISFVLDQESPFVQLSVYDIRGALVRTLVDGPKGVGRHTAPWHGVDEAGTPVASGIYFYRLEAQDRVETRRMILVR